MEKLTIQQNTTYKQLSVNKRINIKSHCSLPMAYLFKEGLLNINIEKAFGDHFVGGKTANEKAYKPITDHRKFGISVEREHYKNLLAKFSKV